MAVMGAQAGLLDQPPRVRWRKRSGAPPHRKALRSRSEVGGRAYYGINKDGWEAMPQDPSALVPAIIFIRPSSVTVYFLVGS